MSAETVDSVICGERCPLAQLGDNDAAEAVRRWAFSPPFEHEGFRDPRFPTIGMMAMHYGSSCRMRSIAGICEQETPESVTPLDEA